MTPEEMYNLLEQYRKGLICKFELLEMIQGSIDSEMINALEEIETLNALVKISNSY